MHAAINFTTALLLLIHGPSLFAQQKRTLRIVSPVRGAVVRPGHQIAVKIVGRGEFSSILVSAGPSRGGASPIGLNGITAPMGKQPWVVMLDIPLEADPQKYDLLAVGDMPTEAEVLSDPIEIDVEPAEIPPVSFSLPSIVMLFGNWCVGLTDDSPCAPHLQVWGTYPDGTIVNLNRSTKINFVSKDTSIARISLDGSSLVGGAPGSTTLVVFGKYTIDVVVNRMR
jgi:hypothetical protein